MLRLRHSAYTELLYSPRTFMRLLSYYNQRQHSLGYEDTRSQLSQTYFFSFPRHNPEDVASNAILVQKSIYHCLNSYLTCHPFHTDDPSTSSHHSWPRSSPLPPRMQRLISRPSLSRTRSKIAYPAISRATHPVRTRPRMLQITPARNRYHYLHVYGSFSPIPYRKQVVKHLVENS